jgi:two-component system chemotaxis sensor kinase CheA
MNLAGELVLSRNQLLRTIGNSRTRTAALDSIAAGLDQVTTELQETIMQTRMQPIGNVFGKFPRIIRDLSSQLGKQVRLEMEGNEVEVDKTIVEAIADPLTHLIRNSADHGIEKPEVRRAAGKADEGLVNLRASHQAGKVVIEIIDDGAGMDPATLRRKAVEKGVITAEQADSMSNRESLCLIFAPGFSTAAQITDVSGRGVGMDVVRTNIEKLGGSVEIDSVFRKGTTIRITLPLTLAIVPSMIVASAGHRYALPQTNIVELVRADGQEKRIEWVSGAEVLRLRGNLIPLVRLRNILDVNESSDAEAAEVHTDQVVVIESGATRFALAVDQVLDSEEIVVKPLGRHLNHLALLAGATILGDGRVAMILDAAGVATQACLTSESDEADENTVNDANAEAADDYHRLVLLSHSANDRFAVSMDVVSRIERVRADQIDAVGGRRVLQYRGGTLPLIGIEEALNVGPAELGSRQFIIVFQVFGREIGLIAPQLEDIRHCRVDIDGDACNERGVAGVTVVDGRTTRLLDLYGLCEVLRPEWFEEFKKKRPIDDRNKVLVCEDSGFFRSFLIRTLREEGYEIFEAEDGEFGWEALQNNPGIDMVVTDVEMPRLDGFGLTERIRSDERFKKLPVIALTSLADDASIARGHSVGVNEYQVKMNKPALLGSISRLIGTSKSKSKTS